MLMNGEVQFMLSDKQVQAISSNSRRAEVSSLPYSSSFLSFFGRPPGPDELGRYSVKPFNQGMKKEDLTWALFNSTEFLFVQ